MEVTTLWQGVYFTNLCAKKVINYFIKRKVIKNNILMTVNIGEKIPFGTEDVYNIIFEKPQSSNVKRLFTKNKIEIKRIFIEGELLKFKYADGIIGCEKADVYMLKQEFPKYKKLKSKGYDWPLVLVNDKTKLKSLVKGNSQIVSLTDIVSELEKLP